MSTFGAVLRVLHITGPRLDEGMLDIALRMRSHRVTVCDSVESAWSAFRSEPYPLVILDHAVSRQQAANICRAIRAHPGGRNSYILVVSLRAAPGELEAVLQTGADDYLLKQASVTDIGVRLEVAERYIARGKAHSFSPPAPRAGIQATAEDAKQTAEESRPPRGERMLIVDSKGLSAWLVHEYALSWGMRDNSVDSAEGALWELSLAFEFGDPYRFLIIAAPLPDMEIDELSAKLRVHPGLRKTLVLVLSQPGGEQMRLLSLEYPVVGCLNYPLSTSHLLSAMIAAWEAWAQPAQIGRESIADETPEPARNASFTACSEVQQ